MSANIYIKPINPDQGTRISCWSPSSFMESMVEAFGDFPVELDESNISTLKGMAAMNADGGGNPYLEIIEEIKKYKSVEIYAVY